MVSIFDLVKSLSPSDKKVFKRLFNTGKQSSMFVKLFDAIDKQKAFNEQEIKDKLYKNKPKQYYVNDRKLLEVSILRALRWINEDINTSTQAYINLHNAEILYNKGLIDYGLKYNQIAYEKSLLFSRFAISQEALDKIRQYDIAVKRNYPKHNYYNKLIEDNLNNLNNYFNLENLDHELEQTKTNEKAEEILNSISKTNTNNLILLNNLLQLKQRCYSIIGNTDKKIETQLDLVDCLKTIRDNNQKYPEYEITYIITLHSLINFLCHKPNKELTLNYIKQLDNYTPCLSFNLILRDEFSISVYCKFYFRYKMYLEFNNYSNSKHLDNITTVKFFHILPLIIKLSMALYNYYTYSNIEAIRISRKQLELQEFNATNLQMFYTCFSLIQMGCLYLLGDYDLLESKLNAFEYKQKQLNESYLIFGSYFRAKLNDKPFDISLLYDIKGLPTEFVIEHFIENLEIK